MPVYELERLSPADGWYDLRDQLKNHVYQRSEKAFADGDAARDAIATIRDLDRHRKKMRKNFIDGLGGLPSTDAPLNPRITGTIQEDGYRIEKVIFEARPKVFVTANLYVPEGITARRGAVLFVCGHADEAKHYPVYQTVARYLVAAGLVVLIQDPVGQGERFSYYEKSIGEMTIRCGVIEHDHAGWQCLPLGTAIARYFIHDAMRGIDYLCTRPEVDPKKIGVTGSSGGGTQTCMMMLCDPRVAAAAPGTFVMNRQTYLHTGEAQDSEQIWPGFTANGGDHEDFLAAMAPKPVCVLAVKSDFFPIEGTRRTVERCKRFWKLCGRASDLEIVEDFSTHKYTRNLAKAAAEFFARHLLGKKVTIEHGKIQPIEPSKLWCTKSGQVRGEISGARFVFDESHDRYMEIQKQLKRLSSAERRRKALRWLKERVFANRKPCDLNPRFDGLRRLDDLNVQPCFWWSQEGIINNAYLFRNFRFAGQDLPVTVAVWDRGNRALNPHMKWIRQTTGAGRAVMVLEVTGTGSILPNPMSSADPNGLFGAIYKLSDDLFWLNDSLAALRVYDVIRALDVIKLCPGLKTQNIQFYAHGRHGAYAQLAAALDDRVQKIEIVDGVDRYADWVASRYYNSYDIPSLIIPGMLQYFDLPDL